MGLRGPVSRSSWDDDYRDVEVTTDANTYFAPGQPDPKRYKIKTFYAWQGWLIIEINYPDSTSYEGNKILVYKNTTLRDLEGQQGIDPHFSENKSFKSPFARFEPTTAGHEAAIKFVKVMTL